MRYEILNFNKYKNRIREIINNSNNVCNVVVEKPLGYTTFGYPIDHYSIGCGDKHILFMGGTHGNEMIGVDFVTQLMEQIALGNDIFRGLDLQKYTIDFIPMQNPEGFIISSSAVKSVVKDSLSEEEIENICHDYYLAFKTDDINSKLSIKCNKKHQEMFQKFTASDLSDEHLCLKEHIKVLEKTYPYPEGSLVSWLSNGRGIDLNANSPLNPRLNLLFSRINEFKYAPGRYNNIPNNVPSPMGAPAIESNHFILEPENYALFKFVSNLYASERMLALFTYHGTGGMVYHKPYELVGMNEYFERNNEMNQCLASCYGDVTGYKINGLSFLDNPGISGCGDFLRSFLPGVLLIELSFMGGNPIGPYGDKKAFLETMDKNILAVGKCLEVIREHEDKLKQNYLIRKLKDGI